MNSWTELIYSPVAIISIILGVAVLVLVFQCLILRKQVSSLNQSVVRLENFVKAMNSGQLGMGREIKRVAKEMANVEESQHYEQKGMTSEKTYEQAGLLLERGATIEEVVEACEITPAEAELLAIMRHSAPAQSTRLRNSCAA